jgi:Na+-transporting methylmalonyl-CoA/oxaloacetate decarboxylase gamma subunit
MILSIGIIILLLSLIAWLGQVISAVAPITAAKLGLTEKEGEVDSTFYFDVRAECIWDALTLWTLPLAAILLIIDGALWPLFSLIGGGIYIYFAGRGIIQRVLMQGGDIMVGEPKNVKVFYLFLGLWGAIGLVAISMGSFELMERQ